MTTIYLAGRVAALEARLNSSVPEHFIELYERTNKLLAYAQNVESGLIRTIEAHNKLLEYSQNVKSVLIRTTKAHNRHVLAADPKDVRAGWARRTVQANRTWAKRSRLKSI
jgi:hypothetical protein